MSSARIIVFLFALFACAAAHAVVRYDEGNRVIEGVQVLQDADDPRVYYYLPQVPRLATRPDGSFEFLCIKYLGADGSANGGLFHALVSFDLPAAQAKRVLEGLQKEVGEAELRGPVPLLPAVEEGEGGVGGFRVVSATLSDQEGGFTRSLITSGRAPLTPGSKAAIAAMLEAPGATLLFDTLAGPTSDVSIAISAHYEALVRGYNATVSAEMETIYQHFSQIQNRQKNFTKTQLRGIVDQLERSGELKVDVVDRSASVGLDAGDMEGLLNIVTTRLTDLMFDTTAGWGAAPPREEAVEDGQLAGRQEPGAFRRFFEGANDRKYITDNQYVLKNRKDVQRNKFFMNLSKATTIRVPLDTAGNLGGLYEELKEDPRYFRIVNLNDPDFQKLSVQFQIDGDYVDSFQDTLNFVSVNFRKRYSGQPDMTQTLTFTNEDVGQGRIMQEIEVPRMGLSRDDWGEFEYQVRWSVRDRPTVNVPQREDEWIEARDPAISLVPPFRKRVVEIEADRGLFADNGIVTAIVEFATPIAGKPRVMRKATLRETDAEPSERVAVYHDRGKPVAWRVTWYTREGKLRTDAAGLDSDYIYLVPPVMPGAAE
jgi:hypothetical protein